jgi:hypothetical protein
MTLTSPASRTQEITNEQCYTTTNKYCACIEFQLDKENRHGFHTSQLIDYTLGPNPDACDDRNAPSPRSKSRPLKRSEATAVDVSSSIREKARQCHTSRSNLQTDDQGRYSRPQTLTMNVQSYGFRFYPVKATIRSRMLGRGVNSKVPWKSVARVEHRRRFKAACIMEQTARQRA